MQPHMATVSDLNDASLQLVFSKAAAVSKAAFELEEHGDEVVSYEPSRCKQSLHPASPGCGGTPSGEPAWPDAAPLSQQSPKPP